MIPMLDHKKRPKNRRKTRRRVLFSLFLLMFIGVNGVSFMHAYRFTHVVTAGDKTSRPEDLRFVEKMMVLLTGVRIPKTTNTRTPAAYGYPYKVITITGDDRLETPVWEITGQRPLRTILLFHGFASKKATLLSFADMLLQHQSNVVLVDFPGHGDSPYNWTTLGHREADVVKAVFEHYSEQQQLPVVLYGTSLGAAAIIIAIHRYHLQPQGAILEMPYASLYGTVKQRFTLMGFPVSFPFAELLLFWGGVQHGFNAFALNPAEFAQEITCPVLLLGGGRDFTVPPETLNAMATAMQGQTIFHIFPDAKHELLFHASPQEYEHLLTEFLTDLQ